MQPCAELKDFVLRQYGKFSTSEQLDSARSAYSLQEFVTIIGNDPGEWFDDPASVARFLEEGGSSSLEILVQNLNACCEGSVGWTMDRVTVSLPNGAPRPTGTRPG
jgi:hypothetical protein